MDCQVAAAGVLGSGKYWYVMHILYILSKLYMR